MVLLGDVREVEIERERTEDDRLRVDVEAPDRLGERRRRASVACAAETGKEADPLLDAEELGALLLREHRAEDVAEQADVRAERGVV